MRNDLTHPEQGFMLDTRVGRQDMIISLSTRKPLQGKVFCPMDFYRFRHTHEETPSFDQKRHAQRPLWIVGVSPFDPVLSEEDGFVVHLGNPRFTARWTMNEDMINQIVGYDFHDEDLNIMLYETVLSEGTTDNLEEWWIEAVCAVAYTKGLIAVAAHSETH